MIFVMLIIYCLEIDFLFFFYILGIFYFFVDYRIIFDFCKMFDRLIVFSRNYWLGICKIFVVGVNSKLFNVCLVFDKGM